MYILIEIVFVLLLAAGIWLISGLSAAQVKADLKRYARASAIKYSERKRSRRLSLKKQVEALSQAKKSNFLVASFNEARTILTAQRRGEKMGVVYAISGACGVVGVIAALLANNIYLVPPFAVGFTLIPVWVIKMSRAYVRKAMTDELEVALSGITTSYMRTDSIVAAIEENISLLNNPIKPVFVKFLNEYKLVNSNVVIGLKKMKQSINHTIFTEWCDAVIQCQSDRSLKVTLFPIINKFSDIKAVQAELDTIMMAPFKEFITLTAALLLTIPMLYILGREWFDILVGTEIGKIILSLTSVAVFVGINNAVNLVEPIEYKR